MERLESLKKRRARVSNQRNRFLAATIPRKQKYERLKRFNFGFISSTKEE